MELRPLPAASRSSVNASQTLLTVPQPSQPPESSPASRKFRALVEKLISQRRACTVLQEVSRGFSIDQGVDPRNERAERRFGSQKVKCAIEVTHYSVRSCRTVRYDNAGLINWLDKATDSPRRGEVRWINVGGVSWDVIKALAIRYNLHPLSVEDVMLGARERPFKVDYYQQHLFAQLTSYTHQKERDVKAAAKKLRGNASFNPMGRSRDHQSAHNVVPTIKTSNVDGPDSPTVGQTRPRSLKSKSSSISELGMSALAVIHPAASAHHTSRSLDEEAVHALKMESGMLGIDRTRIFVFLLKDGTLISIHQEPTLYGEELRARLETESIMRSLPDASLLFHGFLDLVTDHLINIVDEYQNTILEFERSILLKPTLLAVQALHLLSGDIRLLEMAIKPLQRLVYGLRRYDKDRYKSVALPGEVVTRGFMCEEAVIYLADIHDHIRFVILSLGGQRSTTKELVEYTFNMTANDSRSVMRVLLIVTVIFLPLMFITQYFGMNFTRMNSVQHHSDALFWKIVGPIFFTLIMVALRKRILHTLFDTD